jgi:hypothetical protein
MNKEIWEDIKGYEGLYQISNLGRIKSYDRYTNSSLKNNNIICRKGKILKQSDDGSGYLQIVLNKNGKRKSFKVHRLVAETFIDKSNFKYMSNENIKEIDINKLEVNHINEFDKKNNSVANLEWCTKLYNCNYGTRNQRVNSWKNGNRIRRR